MTWEQAQRFEKKLVCGLAKGELAGFLLQCVALTADSFSVGVLTRALAAAAGINRRKIDQSVDEAIQSQFPAQKPHAKSVDSVRSRSSAVSRTVSVAGQAA